jgi:2-polyprenyl-6-methoxyphenol hydroxylase-like FAD-dependent oxidoreductase
MFNRSAYDVLVVGARCAGAATAMLMARHGLRVLAIDRGQYAADTLSTHALMRGGVIQLSRWGLLSRITAAGTPALRHTRLHYGGDMREVAIQPAHGIDALYAPRRTLLDSTLVDAARQAGAEVRHGCTLTGLVYRPDGHIGGAAILDPDGVSRTVTADLVVGADGIGSTVARFAGARVLWEGLNASAVVYGHWSGLNASGYAWYFREGVSAGVIPTNDGVHCVFVAVPTSRFRDEIRHDLAVGYTRALAEVSRPLAAAIASCRLEGHLAIFAGRRGFLRQAWGPGMALVGDAGYFKDPLTAHGMTDALRDAELLANAAAACTDTAFARYAAVRHELSRTLFEATDAIASFAWNLDALRRRHLVLNAAMRHEADYLAGLGELDQGAGYGQEKAA